MPVSIPNTAEEAAFKLVNGYRFSLVALETSITDTLRKGEEVALDIIGQKVYAREQGPNTHYERTYNLWQSVRATRYGVVGGQIYLSRQQFKKRYYPPYVDQGTSVMEGRDFWRPIVSALSAIVKANMDIAASRSAELMAGGGVL